MNNEQLQAAKDQAARELYDCNYPQAILEGQLNTHTERENFLHRAMEIYAEWVMDKTVEDQKFLLEATYTEGIREGFEAARLPLIQEGRNCGDLYQTVDDYLNR